NLEYSVNHVFMPLRLPQKSDQPEEDFSLDHALARAYSASATQFRRAAKQTLGDLKALGGRSTWNAALRMLREFAQMHSSHPFTPDDMKNRLTRLASLPLFIRKQNSGLIFRVVGTNVLVEAFTASLPNEEVMACNGRIIRSLPEVTVAFPTAYLRQDEFVSQLSSVLAQLNSEDIEGSKTHVIKAGTSVEEPRSPPSSKYILDWLMVTLSALEPTTSPHTRSITKRTADDVLWDSAYLPWRRSALWFVLKLALELAVGRDGYKVFTAYFVTELLHKAVQHNLNDELIYLMQGKVARRAVKIEKGQGLPEFVRSFFDKVNTLASGLLTKRWESFRPELDNPIPAVKWSPATLDHVADTVLTLPHAHQYLHEAFSRPVSIQPRLNHEPKHVLRLQRHQSIPAVLAFTSSFANTTEQNDLLLALFDFESHIARRLHAWVSMDAHQDSNSDLPRSLFAALKSYHSAAARAYLGNPEANSQMLLTIFDLWIAIDSLVTSTIPLLTDYSCEISPALLDSLLLRRDQDLTRLSRIAKHLRSRQALAPSIFEAPTQNSFSIKYFAKSSDMAETMKSINQQAEVDIAKHRALLKQKSAEYASLIQRRDATPHLHPLVQLPGSQGGPIPTAKDCVRCRLSKEARGKKISVYERPLPSDDIVAKNLVFEMRCPQSFQTWREATFFLVRDVLPLKEQPPQTAIYATITSYSSVIGVQNVTVSTPRLTLASTTKSFYTSHYKQRRLPATESNVIVNHGLRWGLYDSKSRGLVMSISADSLDTSLLSAPYIKSDSYKQLEPSLLQCTHSVPEILAEHHGCAPSMSTHEYIAFGSLRAGPFVQWVNLVTELRSRVLSFNQLPVYQLIMQTIQHVGPIDALGKLSWHAMLGEPSFHMTLLDAMEDFLHLIEGNWQQITIMRCLVEISLRLFGARFDQRNATFLARVRTILFGWMSGRFAQLGSISQDHIDFHRNRVFEIALVCRQTFDVRDAHFAAICQSRTELHVLLFTHLVMNLVSNTSAEFSNTSGSVVETILRARDHRFIHRSEDVVRRRCIEDPTAINLAIRSLWPHLKTTTQCWTSISAPNDRWLWSTCPARGQVPSRLLHFNLLTGQLLVDGRPLGSLPVEIAQSTPYQRLMANTILHVGPSYLAGSEYMCLSPINGYIIHFGQVNGKVLIRASSDSSHSNLVEFLPGEVFENDVPRSFIQDYVHWIHLSTGVVEFRPFASLWSESRSNWHLINNPHAGYHLRQGLDTHDGSMLVRRQSRSFSMIFSRVCAIEHISWVVVLYNPTSKTTYPLRVELPRYLLTFLLDSWRLISVDFPGYFIDSDQGIGTLHGLSSKLVLRESLLGNIASAFPQSRRIIIPKGEVHYVESQSYVEVTINTKPYDQARVQYFVYLIDTELGRLSLEESTLESRLYRVYLHALTSRALPDSLTSRSGVEEALIELYSAACITFESLQLPEIDLLNAIQNLTPHRDFYPCHLHQMQQVLWHKLPSFVQLTAFHIRVAEIREYASSLKVFQPHRSSKNTPSLDLTQNGSPHLITRAANRESVATPLNILTKPAARFLLQDATPHIFNEEDFQISTWLESSWPVMIHDPSTIASSLDFHPFMFKSSVADLRNHWFGMFCSSFSIDIPIITKQFALLFSVSALFYSASPHSRTFALRLITSARHPIELSFRNIHLLQGQSVDICTTNVVNSDLVSALILEHRTSEIPLSDVTLLSQNLTQRYLYQSTTSRQIEVLVPQRFTSYFSLQALTNLTDALLSLYHQWQVAADLRRLVARVETTVVSSKQNQTGQMQNILPCSSLSFNCSIPIITNQEHLFDPIFSRISSSVPPPFTPTPTCTLDDLKMSSIAFSPVRDDAVTKLENIPTLIKPDAAPPTLDEALEVYMSSYTSFTQLLEALQRAMSPSNPEQYRLHSAARLPQPTLLSLLSRLSWIHWGATPQAWREVLVELSLRLISVQQYRRILRAVSAPDDIPVRLPPDVLPFPRQLALCHPDWLLVQIESNILARPHQLGIATEMFQPTSGSNATLQLNMGEGKSSVIVPFVASSLADGNQLVRVVSLKPLIRSMMTILTNRVASLPNRRVAYFPFSRDILCQPGDIFGQLSKLYTNLRRDHGILLAQPEHILSPKLLSIERMLSDESHTSQSKLASHFFREVHSFSRDILDECDEELSVGFQLIYTLGEPHRFDWHPHRWLLIQHVLSYSVHILGNLHTVGLVFDEPWSFPHIHCGTLGAMRTVSSQMNDAVCQQLYFDQIFGVNVAHLSWPERGLVGSFVVHRHPPQEAITLVDSQHPHLRNALLVLRGLFAFNILSYCLIERRWKVDYGLDLQRSMVAIPFKANDLPSPASEFAHPDLVIVLTCLSYHYYGLNNAQVKNSLAHLLTLNNPMTYYTQWVFLVPPERLPPDAPARHVSGVNLDDKDQLDMLCILFGRNHATVDFYLQEFVFPKSAKSFPHKLQTSGWDLAEARRFLTTGFSGTKDNSPLLPRSINFLETPGQAGTNAMVLLHVLNSTNSAYHVTPIRPSGHELISLVTAVSPSIRVLLDVGAQVLDMSNLALVTHWLKHFPDAEAAIYFNEEDHLSVLRRDGSTESFQSSTYRQQTSKCVVYLDDAHTRGTDLKLPRTWKAAVTLGKKVTKDRLVQGCMRMRQLASGQSLVFFAPPDVDDAILFTSGKTTNDRITVEDVVMWAMLETCKDIEHNAPIWAIQGLDYQQRRDALDSYPKEPSSLRNTWLQLESKSLHDMYHPGVLDKRLHHAFEIPMLEQNLTRLGIIRSAIHSSAIDEEQEREVTHEVEAEPEITRPTPPIPAVPFFNRALLHLACNGELSRDIFLSVDQYLWVHFERQWTTCKQANRNAFHKNILISLDFTRTVKDGHPVEFMQPVRWILVHYPSSPIDGPVLIILSQFEANSLLPYADQFKQCKLHSYVATASSGIRPFDKFDFLPIPANSTSPSPRLPQSLVAQLNLFAGQLYPTSYQDYLAMAHFLGFDIIRKCRASPDGFVAPQNRIHNVSLMQECAFVTSPLSFFRQLFSLRRKAQVFHDTPVGFLLGGWLMSKEQY
ncbi:hypothetical protein DL96DRAFT_1774481, partial [Flagelloscypha sp. PMI_526]